MKRITKVLLFLFMITGAVFAQNQKVVVSGTVLEEDGKTPILQATIQLLTPEGKYVNGAASQLSGSFKLPAVAPGKYKLQISYVGYATQDKVLTLSGTKPTYNVGRVILKSDAIVMKEAVVTAAAAQVQVKEDTLVYNSSAYRVPEGSALEELVKKLPGAEVDDEGKITINGKEVKKIMVDGKEFFSGDTKMAMKNLPVEMVDRIKSYDKKSDLARITGIDDGEEETVIDLTVKKGMKQGWFGNADLGAGTKDRYSGRFMLNHFSDHQQLTAMGSANNTNDNGFPGGGGRSRMGNQNGLNASKMAGVNFAWENDKLEMGGDVRYSHQDGDVVAKSSNETFLSSGSSFGNSWRKNLTMSENASFDFRFEWKPDTMTNIIFRPSGSYSRSNNYSNNSSATFNADPYTYVFDPLSQLNDLVRDHKDIMVNSGTNESESKGNSKSANGELQYNRKLNNKGRNITLRGTLGFSNSDNESHSIAETQYYQSVSAAGSDSYRNRYIVTPTRNWNYSAQITYSEPIFRAMFLQLSYKFSYKYQKSDRSTYSLGEDVQELFNIPNNYNDLFDPKLSQFAENKYYNHDASLMFRMIRPKYNMNVGISLQPQQSKTSYVKGDFSKDTIRNVFNFSPTFDFRYRFSKVSQLRIMYRGRSSQPNITDLFDIIDDSNPLNIRTGNPGLKPSFTNNFRLFYNTFNQEKQRSIMTHLSFSNTLNSISDQMTYNSQTGAKTTMPVNINGNWNAFGMFNINTALTNNKKLTLNTFTMLRYTNAVSYFYKESENLNLKNTTHSTNVGERLTTTYRSGIAEFSLNGNVNYTSMRNLLQNSSNMDTWQFSYGASTNIYFPWNMSLSTDIANSSRRGFSDSSMNTNELVWNAQLSQNFLKGNAATISLQVYDILGQMSNLSRSITASMRSDTEYNSISSYCMLHFIYRLNVFGSKEARKNMRDGGGFRPDGSGHGFGPGGMRPGGMRSGGMGGGRPHTF